MNSTAPSAAEGTCRDEKFIDKINKKIHDKEPFFSFEYFPPRTTEGLTNLYNRFKRMGNLGPLFMDITWGAGGQRQNGNITMEISKTVQNEYHLDCNMHLICNIYTREEIIDILHECKRNGVRNILALRGDPPKYKLDKPPHFNFCVDLVKLMREEFGDYFGISVAGYPYLHPDCKNYNDGLMHLKAKVDAGSDFVISQLFFTAEDFFKWEKDCRDIGITCPIIPGILPIQGYDSLRNMSKMCNIDVPQDILDEIEPFKDDDAAIKDFGVRFAVDLCKKLLEGGAPGLHFYTLNREVVTERIVRELGLVKEVIPNREENLALNEPEPIIHSNLPEGSFQWAETQVGHQIQPLVS